MRSVARLHICSSCRSIHSGSVSTRRNAGRPRNPSPRSPSGYDLSWKSRRRNAKLDPQISHETNALHDSFQPLGHRALQVSAPTWAIYNANHFRRLHKNRDGVLISLPTSKTRLKDLITLTRKLKQNLSISKQVEALPTRTPVLGDIPIRKKPTTVIPALESRPEYSTYNFQYQLFPVTPDNADPSDSPFYEERAIISPPTKFSPIIPPRSTKQIQCLKVQRLLPHQIPNQDPHMGHPMRDLETLDPDILATCTELLQIVSQMWSSNVRPTRKDLDLLMELYTSLPSPRVCYLHRHQVRNLIMVIARAHKYHWVVYEHYFRVIRDMQENGTVIRLTEWAGLIDTAGKGHFYTKKDRVKHASEFFSEMSKAGIRPNEAVYISLFQAASQAEDWNLVRLLESEVRRLGYHDHLLFWTERFRIAGLLGNLSELHNLFLQASQNGVPVDIVLMNSALTAFLAADCPQVAELVYYRLRNHALAQFGPPTLTRRPSPLTTRRDRRVFLRSLVEVEELERIVERELHARRITDNDLYDKDGTPTQLHAVFSSWIGSYLTHVSARLVPNQETIRVFISYHCHKTGRLEDVAYYLNELDIFKGEVNYGVYVSLLHGFFLWHREGKGWDDDRLRRVYETLRTAIQTRTPERPMPVTYAVCLTAIRAFGRVCGAAAAREVWTHLEPFLEINDNVVHRKGAAWGWLEDLVVAFERGGEISLAMCGRDIRYRVGNFSTAMPV